MERKLRIGALVVLFRILLANLGTNPQRQIQRWKEGKGKLKKKSAGSTICQYLTIPSPIFIFKTLTFFVFKPKENGWWMEFSWRRYQCRALGNEIIHARSGREVPRKIDWRPRPRVATKRSKDVAIKKHIKDGKSGKDAFHKIAKDRKVIPDPIDDRKFQEWK